MSIEIRLANMRRYREEAMKHPRANKLYIEDLDISIAMFEKALTNSGTAGIVVQKGFIDLSE